MKFILTAVFLFLPLSGFSQTNSAPKAAIHVIRATGFSASFRQFRIFVDGNLVCKIPNNKYLTFQLPPGQHSFAVQQNGKKLSKHTKPITLLIEPGKEYYLLTDLRSNATGSSTYLNAISFPNGVQHIPKLKAVACKE